MLKEFYDIFIIVDKLDSNFNYNLKFITNNKLDNTELISIFEKFNIKLDKDYTGSYTKKVYYTDVNCLVNLIEWLNELNNEFKLINIRRCIVNN